MRSDAAIIALFAIASCAIGCDAGTCVRNSDCLSPLVCGAGACVMPPSDGGVVDGGDAAMTPDSATSPDTAIPPDTSVMDSAVADATSDASGPDAGDAAGDAGVDAADAASDATDAATDAPPDGGDGGTSDAG